MEQAIQANSPPLSLIKKQHGEVKSLAVLVIILADLIKFFNVGKSMNDTQLAETVKLIMAEYYFLKLEDLKLCFNGMKSGKYIDGGKLFDRLDGQIIMLALKAYTEERIEIAEILSNEKHKVVTDSEKEDRYLIALEDNYLQENSEGYEEVSKRELATKYFFSEAIRIKNGIKRSNPYLNFKIVFADQVDIGKINDIKSKFPQLQTHEDKYIKKANDYSMAKQLILANELLTPLEKENEIRALTGLHPVDEKEFALRQELLKKSK